MRSRLLQVQKTQDRSELLCRIHKRDCRGLGAIEMHSRALVQVPRVSTGPLGRRPSLERSEWRCILFVMVWW